MMTINFDNFKSKTFKFLIYYIGIICSLHLDCFYNFCHIR